MNFKEIEELLPRYYEGETTLEEELKIREFFLSEEVPPHLSVEADLFRGLAGAASEELADQDFEKKFLSGIKESPVVPISVVRNRYYSIVGIAAGILLLAGLFFTFRNDFIRKPLKDTYSDPEIAYAETQKVLKKVSANLNNGLDKVSCLSKFSTGIENMEKISAFYKYQSIIINPDEITRSQKH